MCVCDGKGCVYTHKKKIALFTICYRSPSRKAFPLHLSVLTKTVIISMCTQWHLTHGYSTDCSPPGSSVHGIFQAKYWSWLPFPTPEDLPDPRIESRSLESPALAGRFFTTAPPEKPIISTGLKKQIKLSPKNTTVISRGLGELWFFWGGDSLVYFLWNTSPNCAFKRSKQTNKKKSHRCCFEKIKWKSEETYISLLMFSVLCSKETNCKIYIDTQGKPRRLSHWPANH